MMFVPPLDTPSVQVKAIVVDVVSAAFDAIFRGASGMVKITALFPAGEVRDGPTILLAVILAKMEDPHGKL